MKLLSIITLILIESSVTALACFNPAANLKVNGKNFLPEADTIEFSVDDIYIARTGRIEYDSTKNSWCQEDLRSNGQMICGEQLKSRELVDKAGQKIAIFDFDNKGKTARLFKIDSEGNRSKESLFFEILEPTTIGDQAFKVKQSRATAVDDQGKLVGRVTVYESTELYGGSTHASLADLGSQKDLYIKFFDTTSLGCVFVDKNTGKSEASNDPLSDFQKN